MGILYWIRNKHYAGKRNHALILRPLCPLAEFLHFRVNFCFS